MPTATTRTTPQASLELIYNIPLLDIFLQEVGLLSYARLKPQLEKPWRSKTSFQTPHLNYWEYHLRKVSMPETDDRCNEYLSSKRYHVILSSFETNTLKIRPSQYTIYTDGSKTENGTGSGYAVYYKRDRIQTESISLHDNTTVYQIQSCMGCS